MSDVYMSISAEEQRKFDNWINTQTKEVEDNVSRLVIKTSYDIVRKAQMFAPVNFGFLKNSIKPTKNNKRFSASIVAGGKSNQGAMVRYAPYVEFGTGSKVIVPTDVMNYAQQFRGAGKRKVNNRAKPYFFPAVRLGKAEMITRLNQMGFK